MINIIVVEVLEVIATAVEFFLGVFLIRIFDIQYRDNGRYINTIKYLVAIIVQTLLIIALNNLLHIVAFETVVVAFLALSLGLYWIYDCRLFSFRSSSATLYSFLFLISLFIFDTIYTLAFLSLNSLSSFTEISIKGSAIRNIYLITIKLYEIAVFIIIKYLITRNRFRFANFKFNNLILIMLICVAYIIYLMQNVYLSKNIASSDTFTGYMGILLLYLLTIAYYFFYSAKSQEAEQYKQIVAKNILFNQHANEIKNIMTDVQKVHHDAKNHIRTIELMMEKEPETAERHLEKLKAQLKKTEFLVRTGSNTLDAILFSKMSAAEHQDIEFRLSYEHAEALGRIDDFNITVIASNLLDNAIVATSKGSLEGGKPVIELTISVRQNALLFRVSNPASPDALERCNNNVSSKQGNNHGIGILSVKDTVEKQYNGSLDYAYEDGRIIATVTMFIPMKNENELPLN